MRNTNIALKVVLISLLLDVFAFAMYASSYVYDESKTMTYEYPYIYRSIRAIGMGDAFTAVSDDKDAPFYNPAGVSFMKENTSEVSILKINIMMNKYIGEFRKTMQDAQDSDDKGDISPYLDYLGKPLSADISFNLFQYANQNLMLGQYSSAKIRLGIYNPMPPKLEIDSYADAGIYGGYAYAFFDRSLSVGADAKYDYRMSARFSESLLNVSDSKKFQNNTKNAKKDGRIAKAGGIIADVGAIYKYDINKDLNIRCGFVVKDFGQNKFTEQVKDQPTSINLGTSVFYDYDIFQVIGAADYIDITKNYYDKSKMKRLNLGSELSMYNRTFSVRAGLHEGYPTVGGGVHLGVFTLQFAHYTEEVGYYAGQQADERNMFEFSFLW